MCLPKSRFGCRARIRSTVRCRTESSITELAGMSEFMKKSIRIVQTVFALPWLIFGVQHFMYADFVANLVPAYFPARHFWAYLTGAAMIAAGASLIFDIPGRLASFMIGIMLLTFILLIHAPTILADSSVLNWTRALQDLAFAALMLAGGPLRPENRDNRFSTLGNLSRRILLDRSRIA